MREALAKNLDLSPDFNSASPWLVGPVLSMGYCTGSEDFENFDDWQYHDFAQPPVSGGQVTLMLDTRHSGIVLAGKILQFTRDGTPWLVCFGNRDQSQLVVIPLEHPSLKVLAIGVPVIRYLIRRAVPRPRIPDDDGIWQHLQHLGRRAVREWKRHGFPPPQKLRVENHIENIELLRRSLCQHSFMPTYLPRTTAAGLQSLTRFNQMTSMRLQA